MLSHKPFYNQTIRRLVTGFGTLFNDISIERRDPTTNNVVQVLKVPLSYASKEFWYSRLKQDPNAGSETLSKQVAITLPRMGYQLKNYTYDGSRATSPAGRLFTLSVDDKTILRSVLAPSPWNFSFELVVMTRNISDMLNINEQIMPFFRPDHVITLSEVDEMDFYRDVPIILESITPDEIFDDYGPTKTRNCVTTFNFTLKGYIYSPIGDVKVIREGDINFNNLYQIATKPSPLSAFPNDPIDFTSTVTAINTSSLIDTSSVLTTGFFDNSLFDISTFDNQ